MNKIYILGLVVTAFFLGCTSDDLTTAPSPKEDDATIVEASQDSDVPISFGIGQSRGSTRTPIEGDFTTSDLAVFCLATGTQTGVTNIPTDIENNNWYNDKNGELGSLLVRMNNVSASVSLGDVSLSQDYYYPMANWMKYNFYAYYPKQSEATFTTTGNQVSVKFTTAIDGIHDIIWGRAYPETNPDPATNHEPYSAKYFRLAREAAGGGDISAYYPKFTFEHKLVKFKFFVKATAAAKDAGAKVTKMSISNAIKQLNLVVANKLDTTQNGSLNPAISKTGSLNIKNIKQVDKDKDCFDGTDAKALTLETSEQEVGYLMLPAPPNLPAPESAGFKYHISGTVKFSDTTEQEISIDMEPKTQIPGSDPAEYGFEPGKIYNILITIDKN